jgi:hypothetical protein
MFTIAPAMTRSAASFGASDTAAPPDAASADGDFVSIRGVRIPFDELVDKRLFTEPHMLGLRAELTSAEPFPHLVIDGLFHPALLELVAEEFDDRKQPSWKHVKTPYESTHRSVVGAELGQASRLYFSIVNSGWFLDWLSALIDVPYLLPDPKLVGGGLHESRTGAVFGIHRDFKYHSHVGLDNEMVMLTYLNKGWQPAWGGLLELWDRQQKQCVATVVPEFGRCVIMPHGDASYHGHTAPVQAPQGRPRRSVATYYYTSPHAGLRGGVESSIFINMLWSHKAKTFVRKLTPPILWSAAKKLTGR